MASPVIQFKRGAFANLPGLQVGEPALTTDTYELYVGIDSTTSNNKFFGSHRYWTRESSSTGSGVNLVEGTSNGSSFITLKSPDSLAGITTYTFPATATDGYFLKTNSSGVLSWNQVVSSLDIAGDTGTGSVSTSQTLTVSGTANEIETAASSQSITIGLPNDVTIGNNLTVTGNLYVNGSTTQVNTSSLTVEDRTIELGLVDGSAPSSATTWDLGVLFNYHATSAKKSAVVWEQGDARFKFASEVSDGGGTDNDSPQITFTAYAPIEIGALWVNDCAGQSQVISCTGTTRNLENITIDAGTF